MLNILVLLRILEYYGVEVDIIKKIIIEWDKICIKPQENFLKTCLSEICNPILLTNGGTRWDYRTDFYHREKKKKRSNGKYRIKKKDGNIGIKILQDGHHTIVYFLMLNPMNLNIYQQIISLQNFIVKKKMMVMLNVNLRNMFHNIPVKNL